MTLRSGLGWLTSHKLRKSKKGQLPLPSSLSLQPMQGHSEKEIKDEPKPFTPSNDSEEESPEDLPVADHSALEWSIEYTRQKIIPCPTNPPLVIPLLPLLLRKLLKLLNTPCLLPTSYKLPLKTYSRLETPPNLPTMEITSWLSLLMFIPSHHSQPVDWYPYQATELKELSQVVQKDVIHAPWTKSILLSLCAILNTPQDWMASVGPPCLPSCSFNGRLFIEMNACKRSGKSTNCPLRLLWDFEPR